jgi:predicted GTPase
MQDFEYIIEKLDGNKEARKRPGRNVVDDERKRFMALAEIFAKRLERAKRGKFTFLLFGRTDAGRMGPVNALLGEEVVTGDEQFPDMVRVTAYEREAAGIRFSIVDTPGFCDAPVEEAKDFVCLARLLDGAPRFDGLWFVTSLLEASISPSEKRAIEIITCAYGEDAWRYAFIVFTCSETLELGSTYQEIYRQKTESMRREIARFAGEEIAKDIPAVIAANMPKTVPDTGGWLSELYLTVVTRMSDQGYLSFLLATARRLRFSIWKSSKVVVQYATKSAKATNTVSEPFEEQRAYIFINEEKEQRMEQRMQEYLMNIAHMNKIFFR